MLQGLLKGTRMHTMSKHLSQRRDHLTISACSKSGSHVDLGSQNTGGSLTRGETYWAESSINV